MRWLVVVWVLAMVGCRGEQRAVDAGVDAGVDGEVKGATVPVEAPPLVRPVGKRAALVRSPVRLLADAVEVAGGGVWVRVPVPSDPLVLVEGVHDTAWVVVRGERSGLAVPANEGRGVERPFVWVRLAGEAAPPAEVVLDWFQPATLDGEPGQRQQITVAGIDRAERFEGLSARGWQAVARWARFRGGLLPVWAYAEARASVLAGEAGGPGDSGSSVEGMRLWMSEMGWGALAAARGSMGVEAGEVEAAVEPVESGPSEGVKGRPWAALLAEGPAPLMEPLAKWAPAASVYVHVPDVGSVAGVWSGLVGLWRPLDAWWGGVVDVEGVAARYRAMLALGDPGALAGVSAVVVTADPVLWEGGDLAVVLGGGEGNAIEGVLKRWEAEALAAAGSGRAAAVTVAGRSARRVWTADGALSQWRARVGEVVVVANCEAALARVLAAGSGEGSITEAEDFRYLRSRVPYRADEGVLVFVGDGARAHLASPAVRVARMRRREAMAAMRAVGYGRLMGGWLGLGVDDAAGLAAVGVARASDLRAGRVEVSPTVPSCAAGWGCAWAGRPLLEVPVEGLTRGEVGALGRLAAEGRAEAGWWAPLAMWARETATGGEVVGRLMPLPRLSAHNAWAAGLGAPSLVAPERAGLAVAVSVAEESEARAAVEGWLAEVSGRRDVGLGWLGEWVMVGVADRSGVWDAVLSLTEIPNAAGRRHWRVATARQGVLDRIPAWLAAPVRDEAALQRALAGARQAVTSGEVGWGPGAPHRGVETIELRDVASAEGARLGGWLAVVKGVLVVSLERGTLEGLIDAALAGELAPRAAEGSAGAQVTGALRMEARSWVRRALLVALEGASVGRVRDERRLVEALALGLGVAWPGGAAGDAAKVDAESEAARAAQARVWLGSAPRGAHGQMASVVDGVAVDPLYGTAHEPAWPTVPVAGSPLTAAVTGVAAVEVGVSVEGEGAHRAVVGRLVWRRE